MTTNSFLPIFVRSRLPDTNSSSGLLIIISVPSLEGITPVVTIGDKKYVHFHVSPSPIDASSQRWQGFSFMDRTTWLLAKALHNQCLPQLFCEPVTPENAKQRYDVLMEYLDGEYDTEIGKVLNQRGEIHIRQHAIERAAVDFYNCQRNFLRAVVNQLELIGVRPAISVSPQLMLDKMLWDEMRRDFVFSLPPEWKGIHYDEDRQSGTYVEIREQYVLVEGQNSSRANRISGLFEWQEFIKNVVHGYWVPVEFKRDSDASVSIETVTEGNITKHYLTACATSLSGALSAACAQLKQLTPGTITAMMFLVPERATIKEEDILVDLDIPEGIQRESERLEIRCGDGYCVVMQIEQSTSQK